MWTWIWEDYCNAHKKINVYVVIGQGHEITSPSMWKFGLLGKRKVMV